MTTSPDTRPAAVAMTEEMVERLRAELADVTHYGWRLQVAITSLAGGGSENFIRHGEGFRADIDFCWQKINQRFTDTMERFKSQMRARKAAESRAAKAVEVLTLIEWNGYPSGDNCPCCRGHRNFGHTQGCPFPTLLSDHPAPEPGVEARNAVLEEAAKVADAHWDGMVVPEARGASEIAAAIRALQTPEDGGGDGT